MIAKTQIKAADSHSKPFPWLHYANTAALITVVIFFLLPIFFMVLVAFKTTEEMANSPFSLPANLNFSNFAAALQRLDFLRLSVNTVIITALSCILTVLLSSLAAYPIARVRTRWMSSVYQLFLIGLTLPFFVVLLPLYLLARDLGLLGTVLGIVFVYTAFNLPFAIFFTTGFISAIPLELEEAASMDGSTPFSTFRYIILPLLRPANATVAMFIALVIWNDLLLPLLFFNRNEQRTIMPGVYTVVGEFSTPYNELFGAALLATLPLFIFYLVLQRQIIAGISAGGVKG